jgi:hypothetical protein
MPGVVWRAIGSGGHGVDTARKLGRGFPTLGFDPYVIVGVKSHEGRRTRPKRASPFAGLPLSQRRQELVLHLGDEPPAIGEVARFLSLHLAAMEPHRSEAEPIYRATAAKPHTRNSGGARTAYKASHHCQLPIPLRSATVE